MKKWTVVFLSLAVAFFGVTTPMYAGGLEDSKTDKVVGDLQDQVSSLVRAVNELKQENNLLKARDAAREREIAEIKGESRPTIGQVSGDIGDRVGALENQIGAIKIKGGAIANVFATVGHEGGGAGTGGVAGSGQSGESQNQSELNPVNGDQVFGGAAFWLDIEAPIAKNTKIFAELEVNGTSSGVLGQQPYPSLHIPNGISTFSTNYSDGASTSGMLNTRTRNVDLVNLLEVYIESKFFDNRLTTQVGKIDLTNYFDHSRFASSDRNQFIAKGLSVNPALLSTMPLNTPGVRVAWSEMRNILWDYFDGYQFQMALVKGEDTGTSLFSHLFAIAEGTLTTNKLFNRRLDIRAYAFMDGGNDRFNLDTTDSRNIGTGVGIDYELVPNKVGTFIRLGANTNQTASLNIPTNLGTEAMGVSWAWSMGVEWKGFFKNRPDDIWGLAFSQIHIYDQSGNAASANNQPSGDSVSQGKPEGPETFLEMYYNYKLNQNIHISPFAQVVFNGAGSENDNVAAGIRSQVTF